MARGQDIGEETQFFLSDFNTRLRDLEDRNRTLRERVLLLGNNVISAREELENEIKKLKKENIEIKSILRNLNRICENLLVQSEKFIKKDEAYAIQRMLKDFQPLEFARKKDVEDILKEKFDSKINREQRNKNIKIIE